MKRIWIGILTCIAVIGCKGGTAAEAEPEAGPIAVKTAKAVSKTIRSLLPVDGVFSPAQGDIAKLAPAQPGKLAIVLVKEGDTVKAGQLLASLDKNILSAQQASAQSGAEAANSQAKQSEIGVRSAKADYESSVTAAELALETAKAQRTSDVDQAKADLKRLQAGARPLEVGQAEQSVRQAQVSRDKAHQEYVRNQKLFKEGFVSGQDLDASKATFDLTDSSLIQAKQQLALLKEGARTEDLKAAEDRLASAKELGRKRVLQAQAELDRAQNGKLTVRAKQSEMVAASALARQKLADAMAAVQTAKNGEIRAPFAGIISRRFLNKGDSADSVTPVFELVRLGSKSDFVGSVSPRDAGSLVKGMRVAMKDATQATGTLGAIGIPDAQSGQVMVRIMFGPIGETTAGSSATVNIVVKTLASVVSVPETAIVTREGKSYVFVVNAGVAKLIEVQKGPADSGFVAIEKGLKVGDEVILVGQQGLSDGAKVEVDKPESDEKKKPEGDK